MGKKEQKNVLLYLKGKNSPVSYSLLKKKFHLTANDIKHLIKLPLLDDTDDDELLPSKENNINEIIETKSQNIVENENKAETEQNIEDEISSSDIEIINDDMMEEYLETIPDDVEISINSIENEKYVNLKITFIVDESKPYEMNIQIPEDVYFMICKKLVD